MMKFIYTGVLALSLAVGGLGVGTFAMAQGTEPDVPAQSAPGQGFGDFPAQPAPPTPENTIDTQPAPPTPENTIDTQPAQSKKTAEGFITLKNPLKVNSLSELLLLILEILLLFAVPIIVFFIIYAGFLFVTAQGNEERLKKAKSALLWTVVGGVIVLGARLILEVIEGTIKALGA